MVIIPCLRSDNGSSAFIRSNCTMYCTCQISFERIALSMVFISRQNDFYVLVMIVMHVNILKHW